MKRPDSAETSTSSRLYSGEETDIHPFSSPSGTRTHPPMASPCCLGLCPFPPGPRTWPHTPATHPQEAEASPSHRYVCQLWEIWENNDSQQFQGVESSAPLTSGQPSSSPAASSKPSQGPCPAGSTCPNSNDAKLQGHIVSTESPCGKCLTHGRY